MGVGKDSDRLSLSQLHVFSFDLTVLGKLRTCLVISLLVLTGIFSWRMPTCLHPKLTNLLDETVTMTFIIEVKPTASGSTCRADG